MDKDQKNNNDGVNDPSVSYGNSIRIFNSFDEQADYERAAMAALTPLERLIQMRAFINKAYGMYGYDPNHLPTEHSIKIISGTSL